MGTTTIPTTALVKAGLSNPTVETETCRICFAVFHGPAGVDIDTATDPEFRETAASQVCLHAYYEHDIDY